MYILNYYCVSDVYFHHRKYIVHLLLDCQVDLPRVCMTAINMYLRP